MNNCEHAEYDLVLTPELTHHGKYICKSCRAFLGWAKKPETIERDKVNAAALARLGKLHLPAWESEFILSLTKQGKFSPKQQSMLDKIAEKFH